MRTSRSKVCFIAITAIVATVTVGCRGDDVDALPSPTVSASATSTVIPTTLPSIPPSGSPGVTGTLTTGTASVTVTGGVNTTATYDTLFTPGIWTLPPGAIALSWRGAGRRAVSITGPSFTAQLPTDVDRVLEFSVPGPDGLLTFRSSGGECLVTISPALADLMGGSFTCSSVASEDGAVTVNAHGSFDAQGP